MLEDTALPGRTLKAFSEMGLKIAIDDFGTGYSSLSYLTQYPIDCLKIDRSLIVDICREPDGAAIASTIIDLGHNLRMTIVAEGVEDAEQARFLIERNCDAVQGYLYAKPMPASDFSDWVKTWHSSPVAESLNALSSQIAGGA